jgi:putative adhesin
MSFQFPLRSLFTRARNTALAALALASLAPPAASAQGDRYSVQRTGQVAASGATSIRIANGSGKLVITGRNGASSVSARAVVRGSSQEAVNAVKLITERNGDVITVRAEAPDRTWSRGDGWSADLTVEVPASIHLDVSDGSGGARIENVGPVSVRSGSGGVRIDHATGAVEVRSGSGSVELRDVRGGVVLSSGSGEVTVAGVNGSVDVRNAGSGELTISKVTGSLHVGSIGSGSLSANDVGGDLTVDRKGSGSVDYENVKGKVDVPARRHNW